MNVVDLTAYPDNYIVMIMAETMRIGIRRLCLHLNNQLARIDARGVTVLSLWTQVKLKQSCTRHAALSISLSVLLLITKSRVELK